MDSRWRFSGLPSHRRYLLVFGAKWVFIVNGWSESGAWSIYNMK